MVDIKRDRYLQQLIESRQNGLVKVVIAMISKAKSISTRFQSIIFLT